MSIFILCVKNSVKHKIPKNIYRKILLYALYAPAICSTYGETITHNRYDLYEIAYNKKDDYLMNALKEYVSELFIRQIYIKNWDLENINLTNPNCNIYLLLYAIHYDDEKIFNSELEKFNKLTDNLKLETLNMGISITNINYTNKMHYIYKLNIKKGGFKVIMHLHNKLQNTELLDYLSNFYTIIIPNSNIETVNKSDFANAIKHNKIDEFFGRCGAFPYEIIKNYYQNTRIKNIKIIKYIITNRYVFDNIDIDIQDINELIMLSINNLNFKFFAKFAYMINNISSIKDILIQRGLFEFIMVLKN